MSTQNTFDDHTAQNGPSGPSHPGARRGPSLLSHRPLDVRLDFERRRITVRGELDGSGIGLLRSAMARLLLTGPANSAIDVSALAFIDAAGLGCLVEIKNRLRAVGVELAIVGATPAVRRVFALGGLEHLLAVDDVDHRGSRPLPRADPPR